MKIVLWIPRGKCRVNVWREIIIITKTDSTFHNGQTTTQISGCYCNLFDMR